VLHALKAVYPAMTTHGCRSSFRDWAGDETTYERDIAEMALAHKVGDEVEQAYRCGSALKKRRQLIGAWARYIGGVSNVVTFASREPQSDDREPPPRTNRGDALGAAFGRLTTPSHILAARGALAIQTYSIAPAVYSATD
jgi:hypothetical protein